MRLPRFVFLNSPEDELSDIVLETRPPYFLGKPFGIPKKDTERVEQVLSDIANERITAVKIPGYTMFMSVGGCLAPGRLSREDAISVLRDMAEFYKEGVLVRKKHKHRIYQEGVPDDIDEINGRRIREAKASGKKIFLEFK